MTTEQAQLLPTASSTFLWHQTATARHLGAPHHAYSRWSEPPEEVISAVRGKIAAGKVSPGKGKMGRLSASVRLFPGDTKGAGKFAPPTNAGATAEHTDVVIYHASAFGHDSDAGDRWYIFAVLAHGDRDAYRQPRRERRGGASGPARPYSFGW